MADFILIDGDKANFDSTFGAATVVVKPGYLKASGAATFNGKKICIDGDEKSVCVRDCTYITPIYSISGTGTLKIAKLHGSQKAKKTKTAGKSVLLEAKGTRFIAKFEVQNSAKQPPPGPGSPIPDPIKEYSGTGTFTTTNKKWQGT
ncbi:MAG: hypothetical protein ACFKPT_02880 [Gloeotrichia echinulata GP01]